MSSQRVLQLQDSSSSFQGVQVSSIEPNASSSSSFQHWALGIPSLIFLVYIPLRIFALLHQHRKTNAHIGRYLKLVRINSFQAIVESNFPSKDPCLAALFFECNITHLLGVEAHRDTSANCCYLDPFCIIIDHPVVVS